MIYPDWFLNTIPTKRATSWRLLGQMADFRAGTGKAQAAREHFVTESKKNAQKMMDIFQKDIGPNLKGLPQAKSEII